MRRIFPSHTDQLCRVRRSDSRFRQMGQHTVREIQRHKLRLVVASFVTFQGKEALETCSKRFVRPVGSV